MNGPVGESHRHLVNYRIHGWAVSAVTHALAVGAALALTSTLHLPQQPEPFRWEISLVQPPAPQVVEPREPQPPPPEPSRREPPVVDAKPVVRTVQTVTQVVRQQIREVTPQVRTTVQPAQQVVTRTIESVNQTAQTELAAVQTVAAPEARQIVTEPASVVQEEIPVVQEEVPTTVHNRVETTPSALVAATSVPVSRHAIEREPVAAIHTAPVSEKSVELVQTSTIQEHQVERQVVSEPVSATTTETAPIQQASLRQRPVQSLPAPKADYSWLAEALWHRVEQLKRYPHLARMNRWEGMVVLQAVIRYDGQLVDLKVAESSGHAVLDQDAMDILRKACPLELKHPLGKSQVVVQVPIRYKLQ